MTETSIRELLSRAVEDGPPAGVQVPVNEVLARNGQVLRRRRIGRAGTAAALLAGAASLLVVLPGGAWLPNRPPAPPPAASAATAATAPSTPADYRDRAYAALRLITDAVPDGYEIPAQDSAPAGGGDDSSLLRYVTWRPPGLPAKGERSPKELYSASLEVQLDGRAAVLTVRVTDGVAPGPLSGADPCATRIDSEERDCRMVTATGGAPVRVAGWQPVTGPVRKAVRVAGGVQITVEQAGRPRPGVYGLGRPVLTDRQLADLAADPALLP